MKKLIIALVVGILLLLIPLTILADDYIVGETGTIYAQVLNGDGSPANSASVSLTLWASNGTKILDGVSMDYMTDSQGIYKYDYTFPNVTGVYVADISSSSPTGYGSSSIHVSSPISANCTGNFTFTGTNASQIWSENLSGYTNTSTFGGLLNSIFGGDNMDKGLLLVFALALLGFAIWKKGWIRVILAICIIICGVSTLQYDIKMAAPLIGIGTVLFFMGIMNIIGQKRDERESA